MGGIDASASFLRKELPVKKHLCVRNRLPKFGPGLETGAHEDFLRVDMHPYAPLI